MVTKGNQSKQHMRLLLMAEEEVTDYSESKHRSPRDAVKIHKKGSLIEELRRIRNKGWIQNARPGNPGGVGNTLEDLLGIDENNLPIPNAGEWELKCQRAGSSALTTLFHMEPSPRALRFVPYVFLPKYGWPHQLADEKYPDDEMSFRQTIRALSRTDRGFRVQIDRHTRRVLVSFDSTAVDPRHSDWLSSVERRVGLQELDPQSYWGFDDLFHKAGTKILNCFYVLAEVRRQQGQGFFQYSIIFILQGFSLDRFLATLDAGNMLVDFDARTGHNHGTKFRLRQSARPHLYSSIQEIE